MTKDTADKLIDAGKLVLLVALSVLAYYLEAHELALFVGGGAFGHAVPTVRRSAPTVVAAVTAMTLMACGASQATRTAYTVETARCIANERAIETREGSTLEEDLEDLELERVRCRAALRLIEGGE